jgi:predicted porin
MKHLKTKLALALAASALSTATLAQQVTVYGIIDQAVRSTNPAVGKSTTSVVSGSFATSRIGVKGEEDLGGGIKASFTLEGGLNATNGSVGSGSNFFSRESSVSLSTPAGTLTMGRTDTSASEGIDTFVGIANFGNFAFVSGVEYAGDRENTVRYTSPTIGGAQLQVGRSNESTQGAETDSVSLTWARGPVGIAAGHDKAGNDSYTAVGARFDAGFASVGAMGGRREVGTVETDVMAVTAKVPLPAGLAAHGSYRTNETGTNKVTTLAAGVSKALSKRTTVLAVYQDTDKGSGAGEFVQLGLVHSF